MSEEIVVQVPQIGPDGVVIKLMNATPNKPVVKIIGVSINDNNKRTEIKGADGKIYIAKKAYDVNELNIYDKDGKTVKASVHSVRKGDEIIDDESYILESQFDVVPPTSGGRLRRSNSKSRKFYKKSTKRSASRKYRR